MKLASTLVALALTFSPALAGSIEQAEAHLERREVDSAIALLERSLSDPATRSSALILLTRIYNEQGEYGKGVDYGKQAIKASPESSAAHLQYARAVRIKMQQVSKVRAMFSLSTYKKELAKAIELDPRNVEARSEQVGYLIHAPGFAGGDVDKARERLVELEALDWREAQWHRADLFEKEENLEGKIGVYERMVERDPEDMNARSQLAFTLQRAERFAESDEQYAVFLASDETRLAQSARYQMARSRVLGEYEQQRAVELLEEYIELLSDSLEGMPGKTHAWWRMGMAYEQLDRIDDARRAYERAVALDGDNKQARTALKQLPDD